MARQDSLRARVPESSWKLYLLLGANRWLVAAGVLAVILLGLVVILALDPTPLAAATASSDPIETLFQALITAIVTGVTLVVAINSLVLSQELGPVGDQRERMNGALAFRDDVAEMLGEAVSPATPAAFFRALLGHTRERATALLDGAGAIDDPALRADVADYADTLHEDASEVGDRLEGSQFGKFDVLSATLAFNYSLKLHDGKALLGEHGRALGEEATAALEDIVAALEYYGPAREHVKTLYFQWELVDLSRAMLYSAVPALIVSIGTLLTLTDPGAVGGTTLGIADLSWLVLAAVTVALAPFAILLSYILRIATVAKRTLAIGPFVLRETDRGE